MNGNFQQHYISAESAYGQGDFETARSICVELLEELDPLPEEEELSKAALAWRAFVALLLGNIQLYGLNQPDHAEHQYQLVLNSQPEETLKELAHQGLVACQDTIVPQPTETKLTLLSNAAAPPQLDKELKANNPTIAQGLEHLGDHDQHRLNSSLSRDPFLPNNEDTSLASEPTLLTVNQPTDLSRDPFLPKEQITTTSMRMVEKIDIPSKATNLEIKRLDQASHANIQTPNQNSTVESVQRTSQENKNNLYQTAAKAELPEKADPKVAQDKNKIIYDKTEITTNKQLPQGSIMRIQLALIDQNPNENQEKTQPRH